MHWLSDTRILAAIESEISKQQLQAQQSQKSLLSLLGGIDQLRQGEITRDEFKGQFVDVVSLINKAFVKDGPALDFSEAIRLLQLIASDDPLAAGLIAEKFDRLEAQERLKPKDQQRSRAELVRDFLNDLREGSIEFAGGFLEDQNIGGLFETLMTLFERSLAGEEKAGSLADTMQMVGDRQVKALQMMLAFEQTQMATALKDANIPFRKAVVDFQSAVAEFAIFRGGIQLDEVFGLRTARDTAVTTQVDAAKDLAAAKELQALDNFSAAGDAAVENSRRNKQSLIQISD